MRHAFVVIALLLTSCATSTQLAGPYARSLSADDVEDLKQLAVSAGHVRYQAVKLVTSAPDRVRVETTHIYGNTTTDRDFYASRRGGNWHLVTRPPVKPSKGPVIVY